MNVVILQGISGSGKSTYAKTVFPQAKVVSADHYFMKRKGRKEVYEFDYGKLSEAHAACMRTFIGYVEIAVKNETIGPGDDTIVVDNTNCSTLECCPYIAVGQAFEAKVRIIRVKCELGVALKRAKKGPHKSPPEVVAKQYAQLLQFYPPPWWPKVEMVTP
jgi:predicted kinase